MKVRFDTQEPYELVVPVAEEAAWPQGREREWEVVGRVGEKKLQATPGHWMAASEVALFAVAERPLDALIRAERAARDRGRRAERAEGAGRRRKRS